MPKFHDYAALPNDARAPSFRQEIRVVAAVVIFICILEIIARVIAPNLDYDRTNIHAFPETITKLQHRAEKSGKQRIVFFGNSLMMHGLNEELFHQELTKVGGSEVETTKITPVGTAMLDWVYLYRRYFAEESSRPDVLIVGFVRHHIHDQEAIKLRRLSRHFVADQDLPTLWKNDLGSFHEEVQSTLCHFSAFEGDQPEYPLGILYTMVPDYQRGVKKNNRLVAADHERKAKAKAKKEGLALGEPEESYGRMTRFIERCQADGVKIIFVPMPQPHVWDFNPEAVKIIQDHGESIFDAREIDGMTDEDFSDGYHLGETGAEKFSRWLAHQISTKKAQ